MGTMSLIKPLPSQVMGIIDHFLYTVQHGFLLLIFQDGYVINMERTEKFVITSKSRKTGDGKVEIFQDGCVIKIERTEKFVITPKGRKTGDGKTEKPLAKHPLRAKILAELQGMRYGQVIIRQEDGQVAQIEKTEKKRPHELSGVNGDGI